MDQTFIGNNTIIGAISQKNLLKAKCKHFWPSKWLTTFLAPIWIWLLFYSIKVMVILPCSSGKELNKVFFYKKRVDIFCQYEGAKITTNIQLSVSSITWKEDEPHFHHICQIKRETKFAQRLIKLKISVLVWSLRWSNVELG